MVKDYMWHIDNDLIHTEIKMLRLIFLHVNAVLINLSKWSQPGYIVAWEAQWVRSLDLTTHTSLSPIRRGFVPGFVNYKKGCTRLAAASNKVYHLLGHGRWFSPGTPASSTTKTGRHDIAEILLKVALKHQKSKNQIKSNPDMKKTTNTQYEKSSNSTNSKPASNGKKSLEI